MKCEDYRSGLTEAALGAPAPAALEAHLADCVRCRAALEEQQRLLGRIDGEIQAMLAVTPTAEFLPQVRRRLAEEEAKASRPWFGGWLVPGAVAGGLLLTAVLVVGRKALEPPSPPKRVALAEAPTPPSRRVEPPLPSPEAPPPSAVHRGRAPAARDEEPEVLVPPGQDALLRRFVEGLRSRRVESTSLLAAGVEREEPPDIGVPDIEVKPLATELETKEQS